MPSFGQVLDMQAMAIPKVWPVYGSVRKVFQQYYHGDNYQFPPPGHLLEVCAYKVSADTIGKFERENLDTFFLAFLLKLEAVADDPEQLAKVKAAGNDVVMKINLRNNAEEKLRASYQNRENEEKDAEVLGHSILTRAREISSIQDQTIGRGVC